MKGMRRWPFVPLVVLGTLLGACSSSSITSSDNGSPEDGFAEILDPNPVVRLTAAGIRPQVTHLGASTRVVFVNEDHVDHVIVSAPDLQYGACPEVDVIGRLAPGGSREMVLGRALLCAYRSEGHRGERAFEGLLFTH
jgi:hypothetical protein